MKIKLLLVLFLSLLSLNFSLAAEEKRVVRVAISNQNFSNYDFNCVKISSIDAIKIIDMSKKFQFDPIEKGKIVEIKKENGFYKILIDDNVLYQDLSAPLLFSSNSDLEIVELNRKGTPARYKGMIEISDSKTPDKFNIINVIDIQNYLRGVVSNEMPISFGLEALKAQSVAARNYVQNASTSPKYDVVDSTQSQVYYGANSYRDISDEAVNKTQGIYAIYNEKPISALYFSTSPGITDDWDDVFSNGQNKGLHPYLKSKCDLSNKPLKTENDVREFYSKTDNGLDTKSPKFRWKVEFSQEELVNILNKTLLEQSKARLVFPSFNEGDEIQGIKEFKPIKRTQSGKISELEIVTNKGSYKITSQLGIRRVLKKNGAMLNSTNFYVEPSKETIKLPEKEKGKEKVTFVEKGEKVVLKDKIPEAKENYIEKSVEKEKEREKITFFDFDSEKYPKSFTIIGGGFGHNVGMSQYGAYKLSSMGKKYPEILKYYYYGIKLATIPKKVEYNDYNLWQKTEFYFDKETYKDVYLFINNQKEASEFPFKINDTEFSDTKSIARERVLKINITQYLKQGLNSVSFAPLNKENKNKYIIYRMEFQ